VDFKYYKENVYENMRIKGLYELKVTPIEFIFNANFTLIPTQSAWTTLTLDEFNETIKDQLSLFVLDRFCNEISSDLWKYSGSRYTYEHNLEIKRWKANMNHSLGLDLYFINKKSTTDNKEIQVFYQDVCQTLSKIPPFQSNDLVIVRSSRKNE
jgi:hypothetical protein